MKRLATLIWLALPTLSLAGDGIVGTKLGGGATFQTTPVSPVSGSAVVQLIVALGIVLLLVRYVLPQALNKVNRKLNTNVTGGIRIEESASFAGGNLYVVTAKSKTLLLSVTGTSVTFLADLTETQQPQPEVKTFQEMLEEAHGVEPVVVAETTTVKDQFAEALERLDRLDRFAQS